MPPLAVLALVVAIVLFLVSALRTRPVSLVDLGLAFFALGVLLAGILTGSDFHVN